MTRRRRQARQLVAEHDRHHRRRRLQRVALTAGGVVVLLGFVGAMVALAGGGSDGGGHGGGDGDGDTAQITSALTGTVVADAGDVLLIESLSAYRVRYFSESLGSDGSVSTRTQVVAVRRPFDARVTRESADGSGTIQVDVVANLGIYADVTNPDTSVAGGGLPAAAIGDIRLDGVIEDLVAEGLLIPRERRAVDGRECQVYRTGRALESLLLEAPTDTDYADACVDANGLVLEEIAVVDGEPQFYVRALEVDTAPLFTDDQFVVDVEPITLEDGGTVLTPVDGDHVPGGVPAGTYWAFAEPPEGYDHVGRYILSRLAPFDATVPTTVGVGPPATIDTYVDVYQSGAMFLVVQQGRAAEAPNRDTATATEVEAGGLGSSRVTYGLAGSTLSAVTEAWFVELTGPLSAADLAQVASNLAPARSAP